MNELTDRENLLANTIANLVYERIDRRIDEKIKYHAAACPVGISVRGAVISGKVLLVALPLLSSLLGAGLTLMGFLLMGARA